VDEPADLRVPSTQPDGPCRLRPARLRTPTQARQPHRDRQVCADTPATNPGSGRVAPVTVGRLDSFDQPRDVRLDVSLTVRAPRKNRTGRGSRHCRWRTAADGGSRCRAAPRRPPWHRGRTARNAGTPLSARLSRQRSPGQFIPISCARNSRSNSHFEEPPSKSDGRWGDRPSAVSSTNCADRSADRAGRREVVSNSTRWTADVRRRATSQPRNRPHPRRAL
jgi:hypothetical protein